MLGRLIVGRNYRFAHAFEADSADIEGESVYVIPRFSCQASKTMQTSGTIADGDLANPLLADYDLAERKAILVHKYFLGIEMHSDPGLANAVQSWEASYAMLWRRQTHLCDCMDQIAEIELHRTRLMDALGRNISWETAAHDWITRYAADWRRRRQQSQLAEATGAMR
jgi:hypothetical protein